MRMKKTVFMKSRGITYTSDGKFLYAETDKGTTRLDLFDKHYYKLRLHNDVPILEIDGLRMQLVKDFRTPLDYSKEVVKALKIPSQGRHIVLDTCMGLGYTALAASKRGGVEHVVTIELSEAVATLSKWNPLGEGLWDTEGKILPMMGDAAELIKSFDDGMFSFVIHDPPRFSHAPQLYSPDFCRELFRVCKPGARIFHYVGSVGKKRGRSIDREVSKRLAEAGFKGMRYLARLQGLLATKP